MITRYALFEGHVKPEQMDAFRADVLKDILPFWKKMPKALAVRVCFSESRDEGAPNLPLILAIDYPDLQAVEEILTSAARTEASKATQGVLAKYFEGRIHHHVTQAHTYQIQPE